MPRPTSEASLDPIVAAEALDFFDEQDASFRTSILPDAIFGSSPRQRALPESTSTSSLARKDSQTLPWRRASSDSLRRPPSNSPKSTPRKPRAVSAQHIKRSGSPDIDTILAKTPRPRRTTSSVLSTPASRRSQSRTQSIPSFKAAMRAEGRDIPDDASLMSGYGGLLDNDSPFEDVEGGSESDSSIDVKTPLPHLMFRDGLLSPRSKLLPQNLKSSLSLEYMNGDADRSTSVLSMSTTVTKSGLQKDPRHTERRRQRHRDGHLLRAGMGLTTGLGWSDSEDEDAPSLLTRKLISTTIDRKRSMASSGSRPTSDYSSQDTSFSRLTSPIPNRSSIGRKSPYTSLRSLSLSFEVSEAGFGTKEKRASSQLPSFRPPDAAPKARSVTAAPVLRRARTDSVVSNSSSTARSSSSDPSVVQGAGLSRPRAGSSTSQSGLRQRKGSTSTFGFPRNSSESLASLSHSTNAIPPRTRTGSSASTTMSSTTTHRSRADSATSASTASRSRSGSGGSTSTAHEQSLLPNNLFGAAVSPTSPNSFLTLTTSPTASTTSLHSTISATPSTATAQSSGSSGSSNSVVPRPLRLPQTAGLTAMVRSFSKDMSSSTSSLHSLSSTATSIPASSSSQQDDGPHRKRTLSGPRPLQPMLRSPSNLPQPGQSTPVYAPEDQHQLEQPVFSPPISASNSTSTSTSDSNSTPTSSSQQLSFSRPVTPTRMRPAQPLGARKPRTGTGMVYRTSSHSGSGLEAFVMGGSTIAGGAGNRLRGLSLASSVANGAVSLPSTASAPGLPRSKMPVKF